ncbi:hypothetical protein NBE98_12170 [Clostridium swellfunianum]|uniref:hypothetical protein n=1 Tax=Clostridium swellfunianum TaxID=1367462 RepID=UPI002030DC2F|nr:hypothetical protein [Clostridium swellfunianum]MCM0649131.1 hypothetical protein [Clostridium swellfunianum]
MIDRCILSLIKISSKGSYEATKEGFLIQIGESQKCMALLNNEAVEFNIKTIKWLPGSYEPIEEKTLYKKIEYMELDGLSNEEILSRFKSIVDKLSD